MKRLLLALVALALIAGGCLYFYRLEVPETRTWSAALDAAAFHTLNGSIAVTTTADTTTTAFITRRCYGRSRADAEAHIDNVVVTDTLADRRLELRVTAPSTDPRNYGASLDITLPRTAALTIETSNGSISVTGTAADIAARTSNGAVTLTGTTGGVDISTSNGAVTLTGTTGTAVIGTSNGAVTIAVHSGSIGATTSGGRIDCDLARLEATGHARLRTSNGRVTLTLPADASAAFDLETSNGDITITTGFGSVSYTKNERTHKIGSIGSGAAELTIKTSNGDIVVRPR